MGDNGDRLSGAEKSRLRIGGSGDLKTQKEKAQEPLVEGVPDPGKSKDQAEAEKKPATPQDKTSPTDFKVAEIWIRNGRIMIDAPQEFWNDRARARGLLLYCDDIVREAKMEQPKITPARGSLRNFARKIFRK